MVDQVSGIAGGMSGLRLRDMTGALQGGIGNIVSTSRGWLDKFFPPTQRREVISGMTEFATRNPKLAAFFLLQIALSGLPLAVFAIMTLTVLTFAMLAGILVSVIGALLFTLFCVGVALIILLPTLFLTTFAACFIFLWGLAAYALVKWFSQKEIHIDQTDALHKQLGVKNTSGLNGEFQVPLEEAEKESSRQETKNASANGHINPSEEEEYKLLQWTTPDHPLRPQTSSVMEAGAGLTGVFRKQIAVHG